MSINNSAGVINVATSALLFGHELPSADDDTVSYSGFDGSVIGLHGDAMSDVLYEVELDAIASNTGSEDFTGLVEMDPAFSNGFDLEVSSDIGFSSTSTPEPGPYVLLVSMAAVVVVLRHRRRTHEQSSW
jgi:hypothetical protein